MNRRDILICWVNVCPTLTPLHVSGHWGGRKQEFLLCLSHSCPGQVSGFVKALNTALGVEEHSLRSWRLLEPEWGAAGLHAS